MASKESNCSGIETTYWKARDWMVYCCIVVPEVLKKTVLEKRHHGYKGVERCLLRALYSVWWPGISCHIKQLEACPVCAKNTHPCREPLLPTPLPPYPWHTVATDLFELQGIHYLIIVDYF
jgi:hypothetical protein